MLAQISHWVELSFWQLAIGTLSKARPLGSQILQAKHFIAAQQFIDAEPFSRAIRSGWLIALSGWLLGLVLGISLAVWGRSL